MLDRDTLARQLAAVMEWELAPVLGESMTWRTSDRALEDLSSQFSTAMLAEASANPAEDYTEAVPGAVRVHHPSQRTEGTAGGGLPGTGRLQNRLRAVSAAMEHMNGGETEWDERSSTTAGEGDGAHPGEDPVTFRDGRKIEQYVAQPKRRKLA